MRTLAERFWEKVDKRGPDECWPWKAHRHDSGYGRISMGGRRGKIEGAHRVAWLLEHGSIPEGMDVLHKCDNPPCCNVRCLFLGTARTNVDDMFAKGRNPQLPRGEEHSCAKFTEQQVRDIRANKALCRVSDRELGARYGVSNVAINRIVRRITWKHL